MYVWIIKFSKSKYNIVTIIHRFQFFVSDIIRTRHFERSDNPNA